MATISNTPRPGYVWDSTDNVWYPIGVGGHSHGEIPATIVDAKGDLIAGTAADTVSRLAVGTNGQYLKADSTAGTGLAWATLPSSGKVLQVVTATSTTSTVIATTTMTDTTLTATITPTSATSKILVLISQPVNSERNTKKSYVGWQLLRGATVINGSGSTAVFGSYAEAVTVSSFRMIGAMSYLDSPATTSATTYKTQGRVDETADSATSTWNAQGTSSIVLLEIGA